jgi:alkylhydroperoxidase family enzyme
MAHTASGALHFGVDAAKLVAVGGYKENPMFSAAERAAFDLAVAASSSPNAVTDTTFAELHKYWSEEQIIELVGVIAIAGFLAHWNITMATPIEAEPNEVGEKYLKPLGWKAGAHLRHI